MDTLVLCYNPLTLKMAVGIFGVILSLDHFHNFQKRSHNHHDILCCPLQPEAATSLFCIFLGCLCHCKWSQAPIWPFLTHFPYHKQSVFRTTYVGAQINSPFYSWTIFCPVCASVILCSAVRHLVCLLCLGYYEQLLKDLELCTIWPFGDKRRKLHI